LILGVENRFTSNSRGLYALWRVHGLVLGSADTYDTDSGVGGDGSPEGVLCHRVGIFNYMLWDSPKIAVVEHGVPGHQLDIPKFVASLGDKSTFTIL
jgi:hypothetical protein